MKNFHWFHLLPGQKFSLLKTIPVIALIAMVWMNAVVLHKGLTGGWTRISQLVNQRDMRLIALLVAKNADECRVMDTKTLSLFIRAHIDKDKPRLLGIYDWDNDIWGNPYKIEIHPDEIIVKSDGPDRVHGTPDDAQFILPITKNLSEIHDEVGP